jgi:hypothetical protein
MHLHDQSGDFALLWKRAREPAQSLQTSLNQIAQDFLITIIRASDRPYLVTNAHQYLVRRLCPIDAYFGSQWKACSEAIIVRRLQLNYSDLANLDIADSHALLP